MAWGAWSKWSCPDDDDTEDDSNAAKPVEHGGIGELLNDLH